MQPRLFVYIQYLLPKHLLTAIMGRFARCKIRWFKNWMIRRFIDKYQVDMSLALIADPEHYPDFNTFFIRKLKPEKRPLARPSPGTILCPVDGELMQIGRITRGQLLQAKNYYLDLTTLLGNDLALAQTFDQGSYATFYLAPKDYHRVHMPLAGKLLKTIFVPGKLFSVNRMTSELIPGLYGRNERLVTIFETAAGPMAVVLIGAMLVGSIHTVWTKGRAGRQQLTSTHYEGESIALAAGEELGYFTLGSTVILLFADSRADWLVDLKADTAVEFGQAIGKIRCS